MHMAEQTYQLTGFTLVRSLTLSVDPTSGAYELRLLLSENESTASRVVSARFKDVARLSLRNFGGGWAQLLYLTVEDRSTDQHENVRYAVRDVENDTISFVCSDVDVRMES
jgi:hypothetical protein